MSRAIQTLALSPFSPQSDGTVRSLEVQVVRKNDTLHFRYVLDAELGRIRVPGRRTSRAADDLWKHTCFEAFIRFAQDAGSEHAVGARYVELNFSPSTEWAAYSFESYREGMRALSLQPPPDIRIDASGSCVRADVDFDIRALLTSAGQAPGSGLRMALSAVIEDDQGAHSHWALRHAPTRPDFHHPSGFVLEV